MKERSAYITLIHKKLTGALSPKERQFLNQWLSESISNQQTADEITAVWEVSNTYHSQSSPDMSAGLARLRASIEREKEQDIKVSVVKSKPVMRYLLRVATVAALVAGLFFVWNNMTSTDVVPSNDIVQTKVDEQTDIMLSDGSLVFMNDNSRLEKGLAFNIKSRKVDFKGEAFFEIAKDSNRPFSISTQSFDIEVLGTAFNVFAPGKGNMEEVTVDHGKVKISMKHSGKTYILEKGDRLRFNLKTKELEQSKDLHQNAQSWRTGKLVFNDTPLKEVFQSIEKHFDIDIKCKNKKMLNCPFTATAFEDADLEVVMQTLETALGFKLKHRKGSKAYLFSEGNCN